MKKFHFGWLFPLVLAVALGGLSAWLERISTVTVEEVVLNPNEPQYAMQGIAGKRFNEQGDLQDQLTSIRGWQLPKNDNVVFEQPDLQVFERGEMVYRVNSQQANYNTETREVFFENNVILTKSATADTPSGELTTERLTVNTTSKNAHTDAPIQFQYGQSHGSANGLTYDYNQGLLNFPSRVKATIYDAKNPS